MNAEFVKAAVRAARRRIEKLSGEIGRIAVLHHGAYGSSSYYLLVAKAIREVHKGACEAACLTIVQLAGQGASEYADDLQSELVAIALEMLEEFPTESAGRYRSPGSEWLDRELAMLVRYMQTDRDGFIDDLRLGLAGAHVIPTPSVSIDNRGGAAAVMIGDGNSQSIEGGVKVGVGIDTAGLFQALATIREQVSRSPLTVDIKDELEDALISVEREAQQEQPSVGRAKRMLTTLGRTLKDRGLPIAEKVVEAYLKTLVT